jgi:hypothetical protein
VVHISAYVPHRLDYGIRSMASSGMWHQVGIVTTDVPEERVASFIRVIRRMVSSWMLRLVALVRTDVSEEPSASFIRVTRIGELGTIQAATSNRCTLRRNTKLISLLVTANFPGSPIVSDHDFCFAVFADCHLFLWPTRGNVSWTALPRHTQDCQVYFPGSTAAETDRRGLVVELTRLNVPCSAGGFLRFLSSSFPESTNASVSQKAAVPSSPTRSRHQQLCGKLEEFPAPGRRFYFPAPSLSSATSSSAIPSLLIHGDPIFAFTYRLVDYCHNVTLTSRNDTLLLRPTAGLHCTFRIHLPYGNRVSLYLQTGELRFLTSEIPGRHISEHHSVTPQVHLSPAEYQLAYTDPDPPCDGMLTRLWDGVSTWTHCTRNGEPRRDVTVVSRGNSVTLKVVMHQQPEQSRHDTPNILALKLWYHAEPVVQVVQQCAFGWVSVGQFCVTAVEDLRLPWQDAEMECNRRGGHLASVRSEMAQDIVDNMLLNR